MSMRELSAMTTDVWVIESVDSLENRILWGVASNIEAAASFIQKQYPDPYIVKWEGPIQDGPNIYSFVGHFSEVLGYSCAGPETYTFRRYELLA